GLDGNGAAFQRTFSPLFRPQTIKVTPTTFLDGLPQGQTVLLNYQVQNAGPGGAFNIAANDGRAFISSVTPSTLTLDSGATGTVTATLNVPLLAALGTTDAITLVATGATDSTVSNSAVQEFDV